MLQYSSVEEDGETLADGSYVFQLTTPLITYTIKAPHKVNTRHSSSSRLSPPVCCRR